MMNPFGTNAKLTAPDIQPTEFGDKLNQNEYADRMSLTLYMHPLASFCHKVLLALYENGTSFHPQILDLADVEDEALLNAAWPIGKIPVLRDITRGEVLPETSIILEYLDRYYPGPVRLLPSDPDAQLRVRLWDRFYDLYISVPMQKIVTDRIRPKGMNDPHGVEEARATLVTAYAMADRELGRHLWAAGDEFSLADCAAAPALFYAGTLEPFRWDYANLAAYYDRLSQRPSFQRIIEEARPYFENYPYRENLPPELWKPESK